MKTFFRYCVLLLAVLFCPVWPQVPQYFAVDTVGCDALIHAQYQKALQELSTRSAGAGGDSAFWNFKKGIASFFIKDYSQALSSFRRCTNAAFSLAPVAYEYIGDIESERNHTREALESYLSAIKDTVRPRERDNLRAKMSALIAGNPKLIDTIPFLSQWRMDTVQTKNEVTPIKEKYQELDSLAHCGNPQHIDSVLVRMFDSTMAAKHCTLLSRFEALQIPDSLVSTRQLFRASQIALQCKSYAKANRWLSKAMRRADYKSAVSAKTSLFHRAYMAFYSAHYDSAVRLLTQYKTKYGPLPEVVMSIARSYRNLNQDAQAMEWYGLFARLYPRDPSAYNVLWYMAWYNEEKGKYSKAIELYGKIGALRKSGQHADDALFRIGFCYYKTERFQQAYTLFAHFAEQHSDAPQFLEALYWKAKSTFSSKDTAGVRNQLIEVVHAAPTDYYAFRAREMLALSGDTAQLPAFDTINDWAGARHWLDSIVSPARDTLSQADSIAFERGVRLVFSGLGSLARDYFEPLEIAYTANLVLQFDLAVLYRIVNDPTASYRLGRRLMWRIPMACRTKTPLAVYNLGYPFAFFDVVEQAARTDGIDPFLILAVMRQESVFNPTIVSRAGAVGLMQLMQPTAKAVAAELSETFFVDSLTRLSTNIRYGSHYLKKLLDQFGGNMVLALAAYNGGPPVVLAWLEKNKHKTFDLFIEDIGYDETRGYVKKVLANYWTYRSLARIMRIKG
jgi:Soluble lytic murein transglycosylase and related regulatory proteins (some contain LysM/invasin domains)